MSTFKEQIALFYGNDEFSVVEASKKWLSERASSEFLATSLEQLDGAVTTIDAISDIIDQTVGCLREIDLFGDKKIIWIRDASFTGLTPAGKSDRVKEKLKKLLAVFTDEEAGPNCLIITSQQVDKRGAFYKFIKKNGAIEEHNIPEKTWQAEQQATTLAKKLFKEENLRISSQGLEAFVGKTGVDTRQIHQEVCKLATYLESGSEVHLNDIRNVVSSTREAMAWDLTDALGEGHIGEALDQLRMLLSQKINEGSLLMQLNQRFLELMIIRECIDRGWLRLQGSGHYRKTQWLIQGAAEETLDALGHLNPKKIHTYRLGRLALQAQHFSLRTIQQCRQIVHEAQTQMRISAVTGGLAFELLLLRICSVQHNEMNRV